MNPNLFVMVYLEGAKALVPSPWWHARDFETMSERAGVLQHLEDKVWRQHKWKLENAVFMDEVGEHQCYLSGRVQMCGRVLLKLAR